MKQAKAEYALGKMTSGSNSDEDESAVKTIKTTAAKFIASPPLSLG